MAQSIPIEVTWTDTNSGATQETAQDIQISTDSPSMVTHEYDRNTRIAWMNIGSAPADATSYKFKLNAPVTYVRVRVRPRNDDGFGPWNTVVGSLFGIEDVAGANRPIAVTNVGLAVLDAEAPPPPPPPLPPQPPTNPDNPTLSGLNPPTDPITLNIGGQVGLAASLTHTYNQQITVDLESSDPTKVTVPATTVIPAGTFNGHFAATAVAAGSSIITASYNSSEVTKTITVPGPPPSGDGDWPNEPAGLTVISDFDFDSDTGGGWTPVFPGGSPIRTDQSPTFSPPNVLEAGRLVGSATGYTSKPVLQLGYKPRVYFGYWVKFSNPYQGQPHLQTKICNIRWEGPGDVFNGWLWNYMFATQRGGPWTYAFQLEFQADNSHLGPQSGYGDVGGTWNLFPNVGNGTIPLGTWNLFEYYAQASTTRTSRDGILQWWMNENVIGSYTNVNFPNRAAQEAQFAQAWDAFDATQTTDYFDWFDHVHVSVGD